MDSILEHPFFQVYLPSGYWNSWEFYHRFYNFRQVILAWSCMLTGLMVIEPDQGARAVLANNLLDELGSGTVENMHTNTFLRFMQSSRKQSGLNGTLEANKQSVTVIFKESWPNLMNFIKKLYSLTNGDLCYAYTYCGTIEEIYVHVSCAMCQYCSAGVDVPHFHQHANLDKEHAQYLYKLAELKTLDYTTNQKIKITAVADAQRDFYSVFDDFLPEMARTSL